MKKLLLTSCATILLMMNSGELYGSASPTPRKAHSSIESVFRKTYAITDQQEPSLLFKTDPPVHCLAETPDGKEYEVVLEYKKTKLQVADSTKNSVFLINSQLPEGLASTQTQYYSINQAGFMLITRDLFFWEHVHDILSPKGKFYNVVMLNFNKLFTDPKKFQTDLHLFKENLSNLPQFTTKNSGAELYRNHFKVVLFFQKCSYLTDLKS